LTLEQRSGRHGEEIARQLADAGIRVKVVTRPWTEMFARLTRRESPLYYGGLAASTADASDIFDSAVHSQKNGYGATNFASYASPEIDRLIEESGGEMTPDVRRGLLQRCMVVLTKDLVLIPLYVPYDVYAIRKGIAWEPPRDRT